jgi:hypothetical protein
MQLSEHSHSESHAGFHFIILINQLFSVSPSIGYSFNVQVLLSGYEPRRMLKIIQRSASITVAIFRVNV